MFLYIVVILYFQWNFLSPCHNEVVVISQEYCRWWNDPLLWSINESVQLFHSSTSDAWLMVEIRVLCVRFSSLYISSETSQNDHPLLALSWLSSLKIGAVNAPTASCGPVPVSWLSPESLPLTVTCSQTYFHYPNRETFWNKRGQLDELEKCQHVFQICLHSHDITIWIGSVGFFQPTRLAPQP